jgi:peptidyl-tRNA hydrolase, PTH1 family
MKLIVGLGNVGNEYENNRHNVGFRFVEKILVKKMGGVLWERNSKLDGSICKFKELIFVKPTTLMNLSGKCVSSVRNFYRVDINDIYVVHDDLDMSLGNWKIQEGVGPKVHNGISSITELLGDDGYWRVRLGIDGRDNERREPGRDYVLTDFESSEVEKVESMIKEAGETLWEMLTI